MHTDLRHTDARISQGVPHVEVFTGRLKSDANQMQHFTIPAPSGARFHDLVFSPDGTRTAYLVRFVNPERIGIYISKVDGSRMHSLGVEKRPQREPKTPQLASQVALRWLPDSKRVSFIYQSRLYIVPSR
jgi:hypothetical protein